MIRESDVSGVRTTTPRKRRVDGVNEDIRTCGHDAEHASMCVDDGESLRMHKTER